MQYWSSQIILPTLLFYRITHTTSLNLAYYLLLPFLQSCWNKPHMSFTQLLVFPIYVPCSLELRLRGGKKDTSLRTFPSPPRTILFNIYSQQVSVIAAILCLDDYICLSCFYLTAWFSRGFLVFTKHLFRGRQENRI